MSRASLGGLHGYLTAGVTLTAGQLRADAHDRDRSNLQCRALGRRRDQRIAASAYRLKLQPATLQQASKALLHAVAAGQAFAAAALHQRRINRQAHASLTGKAGQCRAQLAGRHRITAPFHLLRVTGGDSQRADAQAHDQPQVHP